MVAASGSRRSRRRTIVVVAAAVAVFVIVYAVVIALYATNNENITFDDCPADPPRDSVLLAFDPQTMDASGDRLIATLTVLSFGPAASAETQLAAEPLTVIVTDTDGPRSFEIAAEELPSPQSLRFITTGEIEQWPFDAHRVDFAMIVVENVDDDPRVVPFSLCGSVHVPGWTFDTTEVAGTGELVVDDEPVQQVRLTASRSAATIAFGIVILVLLVVLPVLALIVAVLAFRGKRKVEATLTSWMAAMLFATIPLRTFLPGSPPIGSWVDYLVVLWVVAGLVTALAIYVAAWVRWAPPGVAAD